MKKWSRLVAIFTLLALMAASITACGKDDDTKSKKSKSDSKKVEKEEDTEDIEEEIEEEEVEETVDTRTAVQKFWGGDWYGIMWFTHGSGDYEAYADQYWDAMATIDVDEEGSADMLIWYEAVDKSNPVANVVLTISEDSGSGEMGAAISESGWMFVHSDTGNGDVNHADWIIDPMTDPISNKFGNDIIHIEGSYVDGTGEIYYHFFLRKWGALWDDVANDPEMLIPGSYDSWYKPLIEDGYAMPDNVWEEGSVKMDDAASQTNDGQDKEDKKDDSQNNKPQATGSYDGGELVLVDNEYCKVVITGTGCNPYNSSWIGYAIDLENKSDFSIMFTSYAEPGSDEQTLDSWGSGNTCYYNGEKCKTHFNEVIKAGASYSTCLAIDGVTDESQLGNVQGYIVIVNNETGKIIENIPYSF